ncbi:hypothetical protein [Bergeyella zoohelcum]|uniref:Uncharacterized protein n=1 Tax=Bergeyella zoohelcum TaxID=1015 RepID=A0A376BY74_9FLAO|nr:hypothetical protein [Bergeyella zoohelcum]EKB61421.1 hypothetical protein HMPREF9700_00916 [Bergeyella zoohelcum CCUG 30536]SSZ46487.1 Uncharacterised protein [Bergeyella zoohelcum]
MEKEINVYDALELMRKLSKENFPFAITFASCNKSKKVSNGFVVMEKVILGKGYRDDQSKYAKDLITIENADTGEVKHFWLPLLLCVNNLKITHDRIRK